MIIRHYILDDKHRAREVPLMVWARWFETANRIVAQTYFECGVMVSTVFLGIDHRFVGNGPPLLYETMVFEMEMEGGGGEMHRYSTWDDAEIGHKATVQRVKKELEKAKLSVVELGESADC